MKTSFALFFTAASAAYTDAQVVGKSSKAESFSSLSYSFADVEGKSGKAGIRYLIDVDQFQPRELHGAHMSYRMFVPRAKTFKSGKSLARTAAFESGDMSFSMPSAKSIKIFIEEDLPTISSKSAKAAHLSGTSSKSAKTGHFHGTSSKSAKSADMPSDSSSKASADEQPFSAKGSKSDTEFISKASKSSEHTNLFERFLDVDVWELEDSMPDSNIIVSGKSAKFEMSYSILDLVVPGKSVKLIAEEKASKAKKEPNTAVTGEEKSTVPYEKSGKAGKANIKVSPRSIDPSAPSNDSVFYATAIDFTRMVDPPAEESSGEETDMSFSMPSAKSIKIFIEEDLPTISSKSAKAAHLSGTSSKSAKTGHFHGTSSKSAKSADMPSDSSSKASADEQPFSAKGSKSDTEFISKASKSSEHTNLFERFLDVDVWELEDSMPDSNIIVSGKSAKFEMSYSILDLVVPGKSVKLIAEEKASKAKKEPNTAVTGEEKSTVPYEKSGKAGKANIKVSPRSIDPSAPSNDSVFYATAIDFTRMVDPPAEESSGEETSGGVTTMYGIFTWGVSFVAASCLY